MKTLHYTLKDQQKIAYFFWLLAFLIVFCALAYIFMVNKTVLNIVARQNAESAINKINSNLSQLESQNIALTGKITPEFAATLGFKDASNPQYINYHDTSTNLSLK